MSAVPGKLVTKVGAEGVYVSGLTGTEIGIATKVLDGSHRATVHILSAVLSALRLLGAADQARLSQVACPLLRNHAGKIVGEVRVVI